MPPHATAQRRVAAAEGARPAARLHARLWAEVGQASESKRSATIHSQLIVMATASRGVKPHTGQPQGVIRESPHAPGSTVAQHRRRSPLPRDNPAVQAPAIGASGTQRRRRRHQETPRYRIGTEKKLPSPPRHEENSACECAGATHARKCKPATRSSRPRLTSPQDLPLDQSCWPSSRSVLRQKRAQNRAQVRAPGAPAAPTLAACARSKHAAAPR